MRIKDVHVDGFGVWNGMQVSGLNEPLTLFYGPNEAGKTTLMQFLRTVLYGFSEERRHLYLPPVNGGTPGGMLHVAAHNGEYELERRLAKDDGESAGRVTVLGGNGKRQGQQMLSVLLSGVDESIFNNVFAVGIRELQELGTLNDTQAAEHLYNLTTGVDRISLVEVMRELESSRRRILAPRDNKSQINVLLGQREKLLGEIEQLQERTRRWTDLASTRKTLAEEVITLDGAITRYERESRVVEIATQVREKWLARASLETHLIDLGRLDELPDECLDHLDSFNHQIHQLRDRLKPLRLRRAQVRREISAQPVNGPLWSKSSRIEALCEHAPWIVSLDGQIERVQTDLNTVENDLQLLGRKLAGNGIEISSLPPVAPSTLKDLTGAASELREAAKKRSQNRKQVESTHKEASFADRQMESELADKNESDLDLAIDRLGTTVSQLRRRIQIDEHLENLDGNRDDSNTQVQTLLDDQVQDLRMLAGIGGMFIFGITLLLTGMWGWKFMNLTAELGWALSFFGMVVLALAVAWKFVFERQSNTEFDSSVKRRASLEMEIEKAYRERDELDRDLPPGQGSFQSRLQAAEKELKELEKMVPKHVDRQEARKRTQTAKLLLESSEQEYRDARVRWRKALRKLSLPVTITPKHLRQLGAHFEQRTRLQRIVDEKRTALDKLRTERQSLVLRIREIYHDIGMKAVSEDPQVQLSQLAAALTGQRQLIDNRNALKIEDRKLRRECGGLSRDLRKLMRSREALLAECRMPDETKLREHAAKLALAKQLQTEHDNLSGQIRGVVRNAASEEDIAREIKAHGQQELENRWDSLVSRLQDSQTRLAALHQRRGEINQEMKSLAEDRRLAQARFELGCVEKKLQLAVRRWQTLALTLRLLEHVREVYEAERQPETLGEASEYLSLLTDGKYRRIWAPLGKNVLRVDDANGTAIPLEVLSRGTREAVFLSLRLALVAAYARRGIDLPMVLDDVLVNLDERRARFAVRTLCNFAKQGRQLLFFTCHEHIRQMFLKAGADVRRLPSRDGSVEEPVLERVFEPAIPIPPPPPLPAPPVIEIVREIAPLPEPIVIQPVAIAPPPPPPAPAPIPEPLVELPVVEKKERKRRRRRSADEIFDETLVAKSTSVPEPVTLPLAPLPQLPVVERPRFEFFEARPWEEEDRSQAVLVGATRYRDDLLIEESVVEDDDFSASSTWESPRLWWTEEEAAA